jgi:CTP synthase (UTP-ammonia lyase)
MARLAVVGDFSPAKETHLATTEALHHAAEAGGRDVEVTWAATTEVERSPEGALRDCDGLLIAPGSPYRSMAGALAAITLARVQDIPVLATCGGFQHLVIEFARNVLGFVDAEHAEYDPYASNLFVTPLSCSLAGKVMDVELEPASMAARAYGSTRTTERYYCNFGLNSDRRGQLEQGGLAVSGVDEDGEVRVIELPGRRFFVGTLFVPQMTSRPGAAHPLLVALVEEASRWPRQRRGAASLSSPQR